MTRFTVTLLMLTLTAASLAQNSFVEELKAGLPLIKDSFQFTDGLNRIAILSYENDADSTFYYADRARQIAVRLRYTRGIADATNNIGIFYDIKGEPELSLRYYNNANKLYGEIGDSSNMVQTWMNIGVVYYLRSCLK